MEGSTGEKLVDEWMDGLICSLCRVRIEVRPFAAPEGYTSLTGQFKFTSAQGPNFKWNVRVSLPEVKMKPTPGKCGKVCVYEFLL